MGQVCRCIEQGCEAGHLPECPYRHPDHDECEQELADLRDELETVKGAMRADDQRLRDAERRVWGDDKTFGCDAPEHMADLILDLRARLDAAEGVVGAAREAKHHAHWCNSLRGPSGSECDCGRRDLVRAIARYEQESKDG